jgi:hypothetical protein
MRGDGRLGANERKWIRLRERGEGAKREELTTWD